MLTKGKSAFVIDSSLSVLYCESESFKPSTALEKSTHICWISEKFWIFAKEPHKVSLGIEHCSLYFTNPCTNMFSLNRLWQETNHISLNYHTSIFIHELIIFFIDTSNIMSPKIIQVWKTNFNLNDVNTSLKKSLVTSYS